MSNIHVSVTDWYYGIMILISQIRKTWLRGPFNFLGQIDVENLQLCLEQNPSPVPYPSRYCFSMVDCKCSCNAEHWNCYIGL